ncbi:MAG TPA: Asp-tRNA(Asn)/Glu-tRNA(Gln) amidotransferase subunit GatC [Candidatus Paceibacterota bacterium]|nr:Asp-tRNA(Asn)/Glu-tRNA(Gln) amidotransferase subunit GatC [Candidatus Paceibacterota bacterium]HRY76659.1 Asp-tRNA(Asn)/Glu-tRNA(Gln) amidotransferase subunit GatC [Candidatus Paceibacterota bacterium]
MAKEEKTITEKEVEHLLELSRMEIQDKEKKQLADELNGILNYVRELERIPTAGINLDAGDFSKKDLRTDQPETEDLSDWEKLIDAFSERKEKWLKIPPVFDR